MDVLHSWWLQAFALPLLLGCGGDGGQAPAPVPVLGTLSPSSAIRGAPGFSLSVRGEGFVARSVVRWNGRPLATRWISPEELSADVLTSDIRIAQDEEVTVFSAPPGGGASNALRFSVPCELDPLAAPDVPGGALVGAFYFDGWSGPLTNFHFAGLPGGPYTDREPLSGWQDDSACAIEQQTVWARNAGIQFFLFDWYLDATIVDREENLNSALELIRALPDRHGMQYAILDVNQDPFVISRAEDWSRTVGGWVTMMSDPSYLRVDDRPLLMIIDGLGLRDQLGGSAAAQAALGELRLAAHDAGLPGVYVVAGFDVGPGSSGQDFLFPELTWAASDGYDAVSLYNFPSAPLTHPGEMPFSALADAARWIWSNAADKSPLPLIPTSVDGWDPRPWTLGTPSESQTFWFRRTAAQAAALVAESVVFGESHPRVRPQPSPAPPVVLVEAWNEIGEGGYLVPTVGDGRAEVDALAATLSTDIPPLARTVLTVADTGPSSVPRLAHGTLTDAAGTPVPGSRIEVRATPLEASGLPGELTLAGSVPAGATQAVVGFRLNSEGAGPGNIVFAMYRLSFVEGDGGVNLVPNPDFASGLDGWSLGGPGMLVASDEGPGSMVAVHAEKDQPGELTSAAFSVNEGSPFIASFRTRVVPGSDPAAQLIVIFERGGTEFLRGRLALAPPRVLLGTATTDLAGGFSFPLSPLDGGAAIVDVTSRVDEQHWPAYARTSP